MDAKEFIKKLDAALNSGDAKAANELLKKDAQSVAVSLDKAGDRTEIDNFIVAVSTKLVEFVQPKIQTLEYMVEKKEKDAINYLIQGNNDAAAKTALSAVKNRYALKALRYFKAKMNRYIRSPRLVKADEFIEEANA